MTNLEKVVELYDLSIFEPTQCGSTFLIHFNKLPNVEIEIWQHYTKACITWHDKDIDVEGERISPLSVKSLDFEAFIERHRVKLVESLPESERWPIYFELANKGKLNRKGYSVFHDETKLCDGKGVAIFIGMRSPYRRFTVSVEDYKFVRVV